MLLTPTIAFSPRPDRQLRDPASQSQVLKLPNPLMPALTGGDTLRRPTTLRPGEALPANHNPNVDGDCVIVGGSPFERARKYLALAAEQLELDYRTASAESAARWAVAAIRSADESVREVAMRDRDTEDLTA